MALRYKIQFMKKYKSNGDDKTAYVDIGAIMDGKNGGFILKMEQIPVGWDGWGVLSEPKPYNKPVAAPARQTPLSPVGEDGDIPF
jgi:hypothetical protein